MQDPTTYTAIDTWGKMLGSMAYYIRDQQYRAAKAGAPLNALFEILTDRGVPTGKWHCASDLPPEHRFHAAHAKEWAA